MALPFFKSRNQIMAEIEMQVAMDQIKWQQEQRARERMQRIADYYSDPENLFVESPRNLKVSSKALQTTRKKYHKQGLPDKEYSLSDKMGAFILPWFSVLFLFACLGQSIWNYAWPFVLIGTTIGFIKCFKEDPDNKDPHKIRSFKDTAAFGFSFAWLFTLALAMNGVFV